MIHQIDQKLKELDLTLPEPVHPAANYSSYAFHENTLYISGQVPIVEGKIPDIHKGCVGKTRTLEEAKATAQICALNILAQARHALKGWDRLEKLIKLTGFVSSTPDFTKQPFIIDGASDLMIKILGEKGKHARSAVGVSALPLGVSVEIEAIFGISSTI